MSKRSDPRATVDAIHQLLASEFPASVTFNFPPREQPADPATPDPAPAAARNEPPRQPGVREDHSPDFSSVRWPDPNETSGYRLYTFTPKQRAIVTMLWEAKENGTHFVGSAALLEGAEVFSGRLVDVFRGSPAWKNLIVPGLMCGGPAGTYRLAPLGEVDGKDGAA